MNKVVAIAALLTCTPAFGASVEYCKPYAASTTEMLVKYVWLRAYTSCLNADEEPKLSPATQEALIQMMPVEPKTPEVAPEKPKFSAAWIAECRKYYRTFRESDGTVIRRGSKRRVLCPSTQN
jgi:hypothetical protein